MQRHPAADAHADSRDLGFPPIAGVGPDADAAIGPPPRNAKIRQRVYDPAFERIDISSNVLAALIQIKIEIDNALAGAVIGVLPATPGGIDRKTRVNQIVRFCACACGVERRMAKKPDTLAFRLGLDVRSALVHLGQRRVIIDRRRLNAPFNRALRVFNQNRSGGHAATDVRLAPFSQAEHCGQGWLFCD